MKNGKVWLLALAMLFLWSCECMGEQGTPVRVLTLDEALKIALERNPGLQVTQDKAEKAQHKLGQAKAALLPQLSVSGSWTQQGPVSTFTIPTPEGPREITLGQSRYRRASINLAQPLDLAGQIRASRQAAKLGLSTALADVERAVNSLALDVYTAYYGVLRAREGVRVAQDAVNAAKEHLRIAEAQYKAGMAPQFEVIRASVQVENLRQNLIQAQNAERLALANLVNVLGLEPGSEIDVAPATQPSQEESGKTPAYEDALKEAYSRRPEVKQAEEGVKISQQMVKAAKAQSRPDVTIVGNYVFTPDATGFVAIKESWAVTANLTIPLDSSGAIRAKVKEALADLKAAENTLSQVKQGIGLEVRAALLDLQNAEERRRTAAANVTQAEEALRIARVRFQAGMATGVEVTDAEVALTQAKTNQVNAEYDYLLAQAKLEKAIGKLLDKVHAVLEEDKK